VVGEGFEKNAARMGLGISTVPGGESRYPNSRKGTKTGAKLRILGETMKKATFKSARPGTGVKAGGI